MGGQETRNYEGMFIIVPTLNEEALEKMLKGIEEAIKKHGGEIKEGQRWGKRRFTYRIGKYEEGVYHLLRFRCLSSAISELRSICKLNENILRVLIISADNKDQTRGGAQNG